MDSAGCVFRASLHFRNYIFCLDSEYFGSFFRCLFDAVGVCEKLILWFSMSKCEMQVFDFWSKGGVRQGVTCRFLQ